MLWGLLMYSSVVTASFATQAMLCVLAGFLGVFDATYMRQPRSGVLACIAFLLPVVLPTAVYGSEHSGPSFPLSVAFACLALVALSIGAAASRKPSISTYDPVPFATRGSRTQQDAPRAEVLDIAEQQGSLLTAPASNASSPKLSRRRPVSTRLISQAEEASAAAGKARKSVVRRPRKMTDSQRVAVELYGASQDEARRAAAAATAREEAAAAEIAARRRKRDAAMARRTQLQDAVRAAAAGVVAAKKELIAVMDQARVKGEARARAGSQARAAPGDGAAEAELNRRIEEAAEAELRQQAALDDVNAANARLIALKDEVSRLPSVPHLLDNID